MMHIYLNMPNEKKNNMFSLTFKLDTKLQANLNLTTYIASEELGTYIIYKKYTTNLPKG